MLRSLNYNIGILGHVDSGKTSLSKALSTIGSTAAFDKNPQSQARGITLDLGFSAFEMDVQADQTFADASVDKVQFTLVDCPGHASLIRTVLAGAQIIDAMILVIDVTKGIQTQTAECIVVGEILARRLVVVLNKVDLLIGNDAESQLAKCKKRLRAIFAKTRWPNAPFFDVAANPGAGNTNTAPIGLGALSEFLVSVVRNDLHRERREFREVGKPDLVMLVDHCFPIKGQGTVLTGTILQGVVKVGDDICLPDFKLTKRVKGLQVFRKPVQQAGKGDRVGMCITQFAAEDMERGIVCGVGCKTVMTVSTFVARVFKVRFHKLDVEPAMKYHITIGHSTVMGTLRFFSKRSTDGGGEFDFGAQYDACESLPDASEAAYSPPLGDSRPEDCLLAAPQPVTYFAVVVLESPVTCVTGAPLICSRLDTDIHASSCRIAAHGVVLTPSLHLGMFPSSFAPEDDVWRMINVVRPKSKAISIDRVLDEVSCISKSITAGSTNADPTRFIGCAVTLKRIPTGKTDTTAIEVIPGVIDSPFGKSGKVKLVFAKPVFEASKTKVDKGAKGAPLAESDESVGLEPRTRCKIEIELAYVKRPFATVHRFA